jgi:integrase
MIYLALLAGLRRGEICKVHTADVEGDELRVVGKGGRTRMVPIHPRLAEALAPCPEGYFFPGKIEGHLAPYRVGKVLGMLLEPGWTAHSLRHTAASRWYAVERDLVAVQELLGHAKPETTRRYTAVPNGAMRAAVLGAVSA